MSRPTVLVALLFVSIFLATCGGGRGGGDGERGVLKPPTVSDFSPKEGWEGTRIKIAGTNFSTIRLNNTVTIGGASAFVVAATRTELDVLVGLRPTTGTVNVEVSGVSVTAADEFKVLPWPAKRSGDDGPPIFFQGSGGGAGGSVQPTGKMGSVPSTRMTGDLPSTGTMNVLVCLSFPTDKVPSNQTTERDDIVDVWDDVTTFYDQASYGALSVSPDVTSWFSLSGTFDQYSNTDDDNIDYLMIPQFIAECAQGAVDQGKDLDDYDAMACYIYSGGKSFRGMGGWSQQSFTYNNPLSGTYIHEVVDHPLGLLYLSHNADWGRCAHEVAHSLVHPGAVLGEDVYDSDLFDEDQATAHQFEMMGNHDKHPIFSGENMYQLGWFAAANVEELQWDRNQFKGVYEIAAHGLTQVATDEDPVHLVRIEVAPGLTYYIETRQLPGSTSAQVFDSDIPVPAAYVGGVIVTKVVTGVINNNQETRFITLLHDNKPRVLVAGEDATDPARELVIQVESAIIDSGRLVSTVRVEWALGPEPDEDADFDLRIEPMGFGFESADIWVDREPWGVYDNMDADGNPVGNGDLPQPLAINRFFARIHCDGSTVDAKDVTMTYYSTNPPGIGDNGNWTPIGKQDVDLLPAGTSAQRSVPWTPLVGAHTCLKVYIEKQEGEATHGNNVAEENVFWFQPPANSPPDPLIIPLAIRNPRAEPSIVFVRMVGISSGWTVQLPHHWVYLPALGERKLEAVVFTNQDISIFERKEAPTLNMLVDGRVPRSYTLRVGKAYPASRMSAIGGINAKVTPKRRGELVLQRDSKLESEANLIGLRGTLTPARANQPVQVSLRDPENLALHQTAMTDAAGNFMAVFRVIVKGDYKAQAFIVNAPLVAPTQSNVVALTK